MLKRLQKRALYSLRCARRQIIARSSSAVVEGLEARLFLAAHPLRTLAGRIFDDLNSNGTRQPKEHWLAGVEVYLDLNGNGSLDAGEPVTTTNRSGTFIFHKLAKGMYDVVQVPPSDMVATVTAIGKQAVDVTRHNVTNLRFGDGPPPIVTSPPPPTDTSPPSAALNAPSLTAAGIAPYRFAVTWSDATGVDVNSFGDGNVIVTGPGGYDQPGSLVALDSTTDGSPRTSTYQVSAPSGGWTQDDNGTYTVTLAAGQIRDTLGNTDPSVALGTFAVAIPANVPGIPVLIGGSNNVTPSNNSSASSEISFEITNTIAGATLALMCDGNPIGAATATDGTTIISTNGKATLADGTHLFSVVQTHGNDVEAGSAAASIIVDTTPPTAALIAPTVTAAGGSTYNFTVTYSDATAVSAGSLGGWDLSVTEPGNGQITPSLVSLDANVDGPTRVATYQIAAPGGSWSLADNGNYAVNLLPNQVFDVAHNAAVARSLGSISVAIGQTISTAPGMPQLSASSDTGAYNNDDITDLHNHTKNSALKFSVPGTIKGDMVTLYADGTAIGNATAGGTTTSITTDGKTTLADGTHLITARQITPGQASSGDSPALGINVDTQPCTASSSPANVSGAGATSYSFPVVYRDNIAVDVARLGTGDILVTGPGGFGQIATLQSINSNSNGSPRTATYAITPPGGSWQPTANGTYSIQLLGSQIYDIAGNATVGAILATFSVNAGIVASPIPSTPDLQPASDTGASSSDSITQFNNASAATALQFSVGSTVLGATVTLYADGVPVGAAVAAGPTTIITTNGTAAIGDGPHTFTARQAVPGQGQSADSPGAIVTIDTTAPAVSALTASNVNIPGATGYSFNITYTDNQAVDVSSLNGSETTVTAPDDETLAATLVSINPNSDGSPRVATYQITPPGGAWDAADDGTYTINFIPGHLADLAGNVSGGGPLGTFTVNIATPVTGVPLAPTLAAASDTGASSSDRITNLNNSSVSQALQFAVGNTVAGATVTVYADGTPIAAAVASGTTTTVTSTGQLTLTDGVHTITARQQLPGQNLSAVSSSLSITIDTTPPGVTGVAAPNVTTAGATTYSFTVSYIDNQALSVANFGGHDVTITAPDGVTTLPASVMSINPKTNGTPRTVTYQITPPGGSWNSTDSGIYTITFNSGQVFDLAGNSAAGGSLGTFTVSIATPVTAVPGKPTLAAVSDTGVSSSDHITSLNNSSPAAALQFSVPNTVAGATVTVYVDGTPIAAVVASATTTVVTSTGATALIDGPHTITARQQQVGEIQSGDSASLPITVDTTAPTVTTFSAADVSTAGATTYTFTVTVADNQALDISSFTGAEVTVTAPDNSTLPPSVMSVSPNSNGTPRTITYQITTPGGSWNSADNGTYTVTFNAGHVRDLAGNVSSGGPLGTFNVSIATPAASVPTKPNLATASDTGTSSSDNLTNLNNSAPSQELQFSVTGTIPGATVTVYADGTAIGATVASGTTTSISTLGNVPLSDGAHQITARQQSPGTLQSGDSAALTITIDTTAPAVTGVALPDMTASGAATYTFTITYSDASGIDTSTLDGNDIVVAGPGGFTATAALVSVDIATPGSPRTATYSIAANNNAWAITDNGLYTVTLQAAQVFDTAGNAAPGGALGTFNVNIPPGG